MYLFLEYRVRIAALRLPAPDFRFGPQDFRFCVLDILLYFFDRQGFDIYLYKSFFGRWMLRFKIVFEAHLFRSTSDNRNAVVPKV